MRKLYLFNMITLDGYFNGINSWELDWHNVDDEFNVYAKQQLQETDCIIFGRVTYEGMANYWPTEQGVKDDPIIANAMNGVSKIVFSKTLNKADWNNTRVIKDNLKEEIVNLKQQSGKDIAIFGSANLAQSFFQYNLIDEIRIIINPLILGRGTPLFQNMKEKMNLKLLKTKIFKNGNVLLFYAPTQN